MNPVESMGMSPIEPALVWKCQVCGHKWLVENKNKPPRRCPKHNCKSIIWNRGKLKTGPKPAGPKKKRKK